MIKKTGVKTFVTISQSSRVVGRDKQWIGSEGSKWAASINRDSVRIALSNYFRSQQQKTKRKKGCK